ncbi:3-hydroxyacyl-CoA dehydrogenase/enoyl-CoA hydratase family protein [Corynebacterium sanguinis]|uniref:enoyl-CoA hydratase n=1 Tax=Corynebacterium sanguinis TaxID=2594913 RepID=A0A6C1TUX7_9CORY|nr:3-hydroxyacyl-CoA dehydrogenase/enoyl-CoA hydratase family protein [Corynebacterium sanguinis]MCT1597268.1 3-hydroxyacyl-CoA dehydrogenase NAD-binding domain-containing protein [Corynebacterium sanguinis]MCT1628818.1 3-hydroxyacyl-CoA dehydrogenase NAD-binding domain-containing protein [Corynebacterium sanguinis]MCT1694802.1 3-hydroxyacyl-CoA dehydrogenase NAD-binding domain-containing protein [Corynebacterium sanguinis]MCT1714029.1 3-hydroxyacyl-CoA dehydrogenase NAD-binding domain-containi
MTRELQKIKTAAVLGAGSMGAGIAALLASGGIKVHLLDLPADGGDRDERARKGIETQVKRHGFTRPEYAERVVPGNTEDHLDRLAEAEWIVEAVFEDIDVKRDTFAKVDKHRTPGTPVTSNTSTIPLETLLAESSDEFKGDFAITHFFNPPRVMRLVELVQGPDTRPEIADALRQVLERDLGKVVVDCRDTPGFIANRIGTFWMGAGAQVAFEQGIAPEQADTAFGKPFGIPRTGVFGLFDYVGLQVAPHIWGTLLKALPADDAMQDFGVTDSPQFKELLEKGYTGRTAESGFYRGRDEVYDFEAHDYRPKKSYEVPKSARELMESDTPEGHYARELFRLTLKYCCDTAEEIASTVEQIDVTMELGYGWKKGPFALADSIGLDYVASLYDTPPALLAAAQAVGGFYVDGQVLSTSGELTQRADREGVVRVSELVEGAQVVAENAGATVYKLDDGIGVFLYKTPLNSSTDDVTELFTKAGEWDLKALVIANDEERAFSAGANLPRLAEISGPNGDPEARKATIRQGIDGLHALRRAPYPVVGAVRGVALGGGMELLLHTDAAVIHGETRVGFPERNVGLFPAWSGPVRLLERLLELGVPNAHKVAYDALLNVRPVPAFNVDFWRKNDRVIMSPDHVVEQALDLARSLVDGYTAPADAELPLTSETLEYTDGSETDRAIGEALASVFAGEGKATEAELADRQVTAASDVLARQENADRAEHMAKTRKPLNN